MIEASASGADKQVDGARIRAALSQSMSLEELNGWFPEVRREVGVYALLCATDTLFELQYDKQRADEALRMGKGGVVAPKVAIGGLRGALRRFGPKAQPPQPVKLTTQVCNPTTGDMTVVTWPDIREGVAGHVAVSDMSVVPDVRRRRFGTRQTIEIDRATSEITLATTDPTGIMLPAPSSLPKDGANLLTFAWQIAGSVPVPMQPIQEAQMRRDLTAEQVLDLVAYRLGEDWASRSPQQ